MEIFKEIEGFNGVYKISNYGNVMSFSKYSKNGKLLKMEKTNNGYLRVHLKRKHYLIHRLVASYFLEFPKEGMVVNHKDSNKQNNNVLNLEWCTQKENVKHSFDAGRCIRYKGIENTLSKNIVKQNLDNITIEVITGLREYCKSNNLDRRCIQRVINGEYKTAYGYKWALV